MEVDEEIALDVGGEDDADSATDTQMPKLLSGNLMKKLSRVPLSMTIAEHIDNLKARPSACDAHGHRRTGRYGK